MRTLLWTLAVVGAFCLGMVLEDDIDGDLTRIDAAWCGGYVGTVVMFRGETRWGPEIPETPDEEYDRVGTLHMCLIEPQRNDRA